MKKVELIKHIEILKASIKQIKEEAKTAIIDSNVRKEQNIRIDNFLSNYSKSEYDLTDLYYLIEESFGGSFGLLKEDSKLLKHLRDHQELTVDAKTFYRKELLEKYILNSSFETQPLVKNSERHGGPLWYQLEKINLSFKEDGSLTISTDKSYSKAMSKSTNNITTYNCKYRIVHFLPHFISGKISFDDGREFKFETLPNNMEYLFLEQPRIWDKSIVVKRIENEKKESFNEVEEEKSGGFFKKLFS